MSRYALLEKACEFRSSERCDHADGRASGGFWRAATLPILGLIDRIAGRSGEFLLFALTPPRASAAGDRAQEIADATLARLRPLDVDGLILYDIADEAARNPAERPFPFMPTLDPATLLADNLTNYFDLKNVVAD
jgi:hypothetical protein